MIMDAREILRLRRAKAGILKASMSDGLRKVLDSLGHGQDRMFDYTKRLGQSWAAADKKSRKEVMAALNAAGLTIDDVTAKTLESKLDSFERLDRMLASAKSRRNNALREIDRHREVLGRALRQAIREVQDAGIPRDRHRRSGQSGAALSTNRRQRAYRANPLLRTPCGKGVRSVTGESWVPNRVP